MADPKPTSIVVCACASLFLLISVYTITSNTRNLQISRPAAKAVFLRHEETGLHLSFSPADGLFYASNHSKPARFRLVDISSAMVVSLYEQAQATDQAAMRLGLGGIKVTTRSGCTCSGFSNEHGFGRYCHSWENPEQDAWCYVHDTCGRVNATGNPSLFAPGLAGLARGTLQASLHSKRGSFGRKFEPCTPASPPPSPPPPPWPPNPPNLPGASPPPPHHVAPPGAVWVAPAGCKCTGFSNKHGYGASCRAWESHLPGGETQLPWCYVNDACTASGVVRKRGNFGKVHSECTLHLPGSAAAKGAGKALAVNLDMPAATGAAAPGFLSKLFGRRLSAASETPPSATAALRYSAKSIALRRISSRAAWTREVGVGVSASVVCVLVLVRGVAVLTLVAGAEPIGRREALRVD